MNENILWYQPEKLINDDIIVVNGTKLPKGAAYDQYFKKLKAVSDLALKHRTPWAGTINGVYFVKGNFDATDEKGRVLGFMFISNDKNGSDALKQTLSTLGYNLTSATLRSLTKKSFSLQNGIIATIVLIIISIIILSSYGK